MSDAIRLDALFREAVSAIDAGNETGLERMLSEHPELVRERLSGPGAWLRDKVGDAINGFFREPYLLWFIAEDPVRNGRLPSNIAEIAQAIINAAKREATDSLQEQLDYALRLVCWSWIARQCGVQIELIDVLIDAGASRDGRTDFGSAYGTHSDAAIYNGNFAAAEHMLKRGGPLSLTTALCLNHWADAERLAKSANPAERQDAFVQAAMNGNVEALRRMLPLGVEPSAPGVRNQSHGTVLHYAVWSGSLEAVRLLVEAGADLSKRDSIYDGTPLDWAEHGQLSSTDSSKSRQYAEIAAFLRTKSES